MNDHWMAIIIVSIIFGSLTAIAIMWFFLALKRSHHKHEEIMSFIEKGEFAPTIMEYDAKYRGHKYLLRGGILFALGISIISLLLIAEPFAMPSGVAVIIIAGIIPIVVGFGFLLYYFILRKKEQSEEALSEESLNPDEA